MNYSIPNKLLIYFCFFNGQNINDMKEFLPLSSAITVLLQQQTSLERKYSPKTLNN